MVPEHSQTCFLTEKQNTIQIFYISYILSYGVKDRKLIDKYTGLFDY